MVASSGYSAHRASMASAAIEPKSSVVMAERLVRTDPVKTAGAGCSGAHVHGAVRIAGDANQHPAVPAHHHERAPGQHPGPRAGIVRELLPYRVDPALQDVGLVDRRGQLR